MAGWTGDDCIDAGGQCQRCGLEMRAGLYRTCPATLRWVDGAAAAATAVASSACPHLGPPTLDTIRVRGCGCPSQDASGGAAVAIWECALHGSCVQVGTSTDASVRSCKGCPDRGL